jgi:cell division septation protein DedD
MENRLKERLTGGAILVALIVLVVPELFHGQRDAVPAGANAPGDAPALRSYVIDLKDSAAHDAAPPAPQPAAPPTPPIPPSAAIPTPAPGQAPAATPIPTPTVTPATAPPPGAAVAAPPAAPVVPKSGNSAEWSVQLGLFAQRENAQRLMAAAQSKGFAVSIAGADASGLYRVHVTGLADRAAAENVRVRLRAEGFAAALVGPQGREP